MLVVQCCDAAVFRLQVCHLVFEGFDGLRKCKSRSHRWTNCWLVLVRRGFRHAIRYRHRLGNVNRMFGMLLGVEGYDPGANCAVFALMLAKTIEHSASTGGKGWMDICSLDRVDRDVRNDEGRSHFVSRMMSAMRCGRCEVVILNLTETLGAVATVGCVGLEGKVFFGSCSHLLANVLQEAMAKDTGIG